MTIPGTSLRGSGKGPRRRWSAALATATLVAGLLQATPARADDDPSGRPPVQESVAVAVQPVATSPGLPEADQPHDSDEIPDDGLPAVTWPTAGSVEVVLPGGSSLVRAQKSVTVGGLPVRVAASTAPVAAAKGSGAAKSLAVTSAPTKVRLDVLPPAAAQSAGVDGVLLRVTRDDGGTSTGMVSVQVDYSAFAQGVGGDWASRLQLATLPACDVTGDDSSCADPTPILTDNDTEAGTATADVPAQPSVGGALHLKASAGGAELSAGSPVLVALTAAASGPSGSFAASSLSPAGSWSAGSGDGSFGWKYPMRVPPALAGPSPDLELNYSSSSVDGLTGSTNNQASWVGDGFDLSSGFIERSYRSCDKDGENSTGKEKYDLCWPDSGDHLTMQFAGRNGELVKKSANEWRLKDDDGTRIVRKTGGTGESAQYFTVTTSEGNTYYFGRGKGGPTGKDDTRSAWSTPVYGNNSGEPCYNSDFAKARCSQLWRWNFDKVVDVHGNSMTYFYQKETNRYGANRNDTSVEYDRGGYLDHIDYGQREGEDSTAPMRVNFAVAERCKGTDADCQPEKLVKATAKSWPDVPQDQICTDTKTCKDQFAPAFFTRKRLKTVTTQVLGSDKKYDDVDVWALAQSFPDSGDASTANLWLDSITHTGKVGSTAVTMPPTVFTRVQLPNRVDKDGDDRLPYNRYRIAAIQAEAGGVTSVNYTKAECTPTSLPDPKTNTKLCFPSYWSKEGQVGSKLDWFNKYVVDSVNESPRNGQDAARRTSYVYDGGAAWHYDDSEIVKAKEKTWSQFRGFQKVTTIVGDPGGPTVKTEQTYLRGMDGDKGKSDVSVTATDGTKVTDSDRLQSFPFEARQLDSKTGAEIGGTVNTPWLSTATATEGDDNSYLLGVGRTVTRTALDGGKVRRVGITHHYDGYGMLSYSEDQSDIGADGKDDGTDADDDSCTRYTYARNPDANLLTLLTRVQTVSTGCDQTPSYPADAVSDIVTLYDGAELTSDGAIPAQKPGTGDITSSYKLKGYSGGKPVYVTATTSTYDAYGRVRTSSVGGRSDHTTTTSYTPAAGGPITGMTVTDPDKQKTSSVIDPSLGLVTGTTDANGAKTTLGYDGLGRLTKVWLPGRDTSGGPNIGYQYIVSNNSPTAVATTTLHGASSTTDYTLYDGLMRPLQTQATTDHGDRIVSGTIYDERGLTVASEGPYYVKGAPQAKYVAPDSADTGIPTRTLTTYDGAGRPTVQTLQVAGKDKWSTTTSYHGDHTSVTPPTGGTPTTTYTNAYGLTTRLLEYHGATATGDYDETSYGYDHADRLAKVTKAGHAWTYGYDIEGRIDASTDPDAGKSSTTYDDLDQVKTSTDGAGHTLTYGYDVLGRPTSVDDGKTPLLAWTYDTAKNGLGRAATAIRYTGGQAYTTAVDAYDNQGRATDSTVTIPAAEGKLSGAYHYSTAYNTDGTVSSIKLPAAGDVAAETIYPGYTSIGQSNFLFGQLANVKDSTGYLGDTQYSPYGEVLQQQFDLDNSHFAYATNTYEEGTRRLQRVQVSRTVAKGFDSDVSYAYDPAGNATQIADTGTAAGDKPDVQCLQYDYLRRLTQAWAQSDSACAATPAQSLLGGPAPYWQTFGYDEAGNRTSQTDHAINDSTAEVTKTFTPYGSGKQPEHGLATTQVSTKLKDSTTVTGDTYKYDTAGNLQKRTVGADIDQTLNWTDDGRLEKVTNQDGKATSFVYDATGARLIGRDETGNATTLYLAGQELRLDNATGNIAGTRYYTSGGKLVAVRTGTGVTFVTGGENGTKQVAIKSADASLAVQRTKPFGELRGTTVAMPGSKGFVGGTNDSSLGLIGVGAREYDPGTGRFLSPDPVVDFSDPQQLNAYAYGRNNPFAFADPSGMHWDWNVTGHIALDLIGFIPVVGTAAEVINGTWYAYQGDWVNASMAYASAIPIAGDFADGGKLIKDGVEVGEAAKAANNAHKVEAAADAAKELKPAEAPVAKPAPKPEEPATPKSEPADKPDGSATPKEDTPSNKGDSDAPGKPAEKPAAAKCHSFDPATDVVMADGSSKTIASIKVGDRVKAENPATGKDANEPVVALHINRDRDLTDLTITTSAGNDNNGKQVVKTTQHHNFYSETRHRWIEAAHLKAGERLHTGTSSSTATVTAVLNYRDVHTMRDLTVAHIHTYYVLAGNTPVLVHNCGEAVVHLDPVERHATISIRNGDEVLHTEQLGTTGTDAIPALRTASHSPTTINVRIPLRNPGGAMAYQEVTLGRNLGPYNEVSQSCVTYCGNVLKAGGVEGVPDTTLGITKWLLQQHG